MDRRGYVLITDAVIALVISMVIMVVVFYLNHAFTDISRPEYNFMFLHQSSEDALDVMNKKKILDEVGYNWALSRGNRSSGYWINATNLSKEYLEDVLPGHVGYRLMVEDQEICNSSWNQKRVSGDEKTEETHAVRLLVGFGENKTVVGYTAISKLADIKSKTNSAFAFFGGFVGNGNISRFIDLPDDAEHKGAYIELNAGGDFDLYINGVKCGVYHPSGVHMGANIKTGNIGACSFGPGRNSIYIRFTGDNISEQYIGGGYIEARYKTGYLVEPFEKRFYFPGIEGFINLYSSFYIPAATLNKITGYLHYRKPETEGRTLEFRAGNHIIYSSNDSGEIMYNLGDSNFTNYFTHAALSRETIPIRMIIRGGNGTVDTVLITDLSNSMNYCMKPPEENLSKGVYIWIDAEDADHIEAPMVNASGKYTSGEEYIHTPNGGGCGGAYANYSFNISKEGVYVIWGRVSGLDGGSDSFWVSMDGGAETQWDIPVNGWIWDTVSTTYTLPAEEHTLKIRCGEDGSRIDSLLITNNVTASSPVWKGGVGREPSNCTANCSELGYCRYVDKGGWGFAHKDIILEDLSPEPTCEGAQLILHFNECGGNTVRDASGNGNDGSIKGGAGWVNGTSGYALRFDGSNDYINIPNSGSLQVDGDMTLAFWIKGRNIGAHRLNPLDKKYAGEFALTIETNGGLSYYHGGGSSYWGWKALNAGSLVNDVWQFVVITRNTSTRTMKSYLNGTLQKTATYSSTSNKLPSKSTNPVRIARGYTGHYLNAVIDEVRIYSRTLTDAEIQNLHTYSAPSIAWCNDTDPAIDPCCYKECSTSRYEVPYGSCVDGVDCCMECDPGFNHTVDSCTPGVDCCSYICNETSRHEVDIGACNSTNATQCCTACDLAYPHLVSSCIPGINCCSFGCSWMARVEVGYGACDPANATQCCIGCDPVFNHTVTSCTQGVDPCCSRACNESSRQAVAYGSCTDGTDCCTSCDPAYNHILGFCNVTTDECCSRACDEGSRQAVAYGSCTDGTDCCTSCDPAYNHTVASCTPGVDPCCSSGGCDEPTRQAVAYGSCTDGTDCCTSCDPAYNHILGFCNVTTDECCSRACDEGSRQAVAYGSCTDGTDCCTSCDPAYNHILGFCNVTTDECCSRACDEGSRQAVAYGSCTDGTDCCTSCDPAYNHILGFCNVTTDECCSRACDEGSRQAVAYGSCTDGTDCCTSCDSNYDHKVGLCTVGVDCCTTTTVQNDGSITRQEYNDHCEPVPGIDDDRPCNSDTSGDCPEDCSGDCLNSTHYTQCNFDWNPPLDTHEVPSCEGINSDECHFSNDKYYASNMSDYRATIIEYRQANYSQANYEYRQANYSQANYEYRQANYSQANYEYRQANYSQADHEYWQANYSQTNYEYMQANYSQANYEYWQANYSQAPAWFMINNYSQADRVYYQANYSSADYAYYNGSEYSVGDYICRSRYWGDGFDNSTWLPVNLNDGSSSTVYWDWRREDACDYCMQFYRKDFNVSDTSLITSLELYVRSDDGSICYINNKRVGHDSRCQGDKYWNYQTDVDVGVLRNGNNTLSCAVKEGGGGEGFDAELTANAGGVMLVPRKSTWVYYHQEEQCGQGCDPADTMDENNRCEYGEFVEDCDGYNTVLPWWSGPDGSHVCPPNYCTYLGEEGFCVRCDIVRIKLAKRLDNDFINYLLENGTGISIGLVGYGNDVCTNTSLTINQPALNSDVNAYQANCGGTCISCAIKAGIDMFNSSTTGAKRKYMVIMSDGEANTCIDSTPGTCDNSPYGCPDAVNETITLACMACKDYNITVYTIGFGGDAGADTLNKSATCYGQCNGRFYQSDDPDELKEIYINIAKEVVQSAQTIETDILNTTLYNDSYLEFDYDPYIPLGYGEVAVTYTSPRFNNGVGCNGTIYIPADISSVADFKVTSYSAEHWTDFVKVIDPPAAITALDLLNDYSHIYFNIGDPYITYIQPDTLVLGANNTIQVLTGDSPPHGVTNCSVDNRAIATFALKAFAKTEGMVFPDSVGCNWSIKFENGSTANANIPDTYTGDSKCFFNETEQTKDLDDARNYAVYMLLNQLDFNKNGKVDIYFDFDDIEVQVIPTSGVRSLWGPIKIKLVLWI